MMAVFRQRPHQCDCPNRGRISPPACRCAVGGLRPDRAIDSGRPRRLTRARGLPGGDRQANWDRPGSATPLTIRDRILGGLAVARPAGSPPFSRADVQVVKTFAAQASVALELSQVRDELRHLAVVQERERIAREMHDGLIQSLFGLGMNLQSLATSTTFPPAVSELAVDGIDAAIRDLRGYIFGLRPGLLADRELESALRRLTDELRLTGGLATEVDINPVTATLLSSRAGDIVQVTREALSNVRKHARASRVRVNLTHAGARALLEVVDDGEGIAAFAGQGLGLDNMRTRGERLGGELLVGPGLNGRGTSVRLSVPL
jgi:signal transduction histidine kinase